CRPCSAASTESDQRARRQAPARNGKDHRQKARPVPARADRSRAMGERRPSGRGGMNRQSELTDRWRSDVVLKCDVFSTVERGRFQTPAGDVPAVLRRIDEVPWWSRPVARLLFAREGGGLRRATPLHIAPPLLFSGRQELVRGWIDGVAMHIAR